MFGNMPTFIKYLLFTLSLLCSTTLSAPTANELRATSRAEGYNNGAYFVNWAIYARNYSPQQLPASELSHVFYAFANIQPNGTVYLSDTWSDLQYKWSTDSTNATGNNLYGCLKQLYLKKKANRGLKTLLSIGGWTYSSNFAAATSTAATRAEFAASSVKLLAELGFDGLDIDWEYPANDTEATNFVLLLQAVRMALDAYAAVSAPGYHFLLTAATSAGPAHYDIMHLADMNRYLDVFNLMAYDYSGSWDNHTGHNSNLFPTNNGSSTPYSTIKALTDYQAAGVPASKIVMGIPIYGRSFENTTGMGAPYSGVGVGSWEAGVWDYKVLPRSANAKVTFDEKLVATYSYDATTKELISFDDPRSVKAKAKYVKKSGLAGSMFWETSADKSGDESLISTTKKVFGKLECSQNMLVYPASPYDNLRAGMPGE